MTTPERSVEELLPVMGKAYTDLSVQVAYKEGYNKALQAEHQKREEMVEALKTLWLSVQFLDKYSEDEHYWNKAKGSNHTVEMHITDFEKLRQALTHPNNTK